MTALEKQCSIAAARLLVNAPKPVREMNTAELILYTMRAVSLGAHLGLNVAERAGAKR